MTDRWELLPRIRNAWRGFIQWWTTLRLAGLALFGLALLVGALGHLNRTQQLVEPFYANASTGLVSIAITVLIVDRLYQRREMEREKKRLILQMGSPDNAFAREAARALRSYGWLQDGSVSGASLWYANLQGADLTQANLQDADLLRANLQDADLLRANLQDADLLRANLQDAFLWSASLQGAYLGRANLQSADLSHADLQGAILENVNLQGANLGGADLLGARYNNATRRPEGFTPPPEGVKVEESEP